MQVLLGYLAGLLTLINPCVVPVLPIVLASSLHRHRLAPVALAAGMSVAFVVLGLAVSALGPALGIYPENLAGAAAVAMVVFGTVLLVPALGRGFQTATAGLAARADGGIDAVSGQGLGGQAVTGALLGAVWSPCIGPTLGGAIALAASGGSLWQAGAVMAAFAAGVSTLILGLAYGARATLQRRQVALRALATRSRPVMGVVLIAVGLALAIGLHHHFERWAIDTLPPWLIDLSVSL